MKHAGKLRHRVFIDQPRRVPDGQGGHEDGFVEIGKVPAGLDRLRGSEVVIQDRKAGKVTTVITVRADSRTRDITNNWRLRDALDKQRASAYWNTRNRWTGEVFNVRSAIPTPDNRWIEITCESGVAT